RPLDVAVREPVRNLGGEAEPVPDPCTVEFGGRRGGRRGVVVVTRAEQLPGDRVVLLLAQRRDPYALRLQQPLRLAVPSLGQHPHLPLVLPYKLDPHQVVVLKIQEVVPRELVVLVLRTGQLPQLIRRSPLEDPQRLQQFPPPGPCRVLPVSTTPWDMRVVGPAPTPCPPGLACGNSRPVATGRGGGGGGVHGGGLSGPVKGLGLVCGA